MQDHAEAAQSKGILLSDDLIFTSRITATARSLGVTITTARAMDALTALVEQSCPDCIIVDLSHPQLQIGNLIDQLRQKCQPLPRLVAYGSHVDAATLRAAREAGCDVVLPRSKFVEELPSQLSAWACARN